MTLDLLRGRQVSVPLTNKSGGGVIAGDVVIVDSTTDVSFTTTTDEGQTADMVGVAAETIANDAIGRIIMDGYTPIILLDGAASYGDTFGTDSVAKQASPHAAFAVGDFGQVISEGATPAAILWGGYPMQAGAINPMTTAGDIVYGGVSGLPTRLGIGTALQTLITNAGATAPEWAAAVGKTDIGARVYNDANISIPDNTETAVTFNTEEWDTDTIHDPSTNPERLTAKTAGKYLGHVL